MRISPTFVAPARAGTSIVLRPVEVGDVGRGLLEVLDQLSAAGVAGLSVERGRELIEEMVGRGVERLWVAVRGEEGNEEVIGAATLVVEQKLIHGGRRAGRIEDVVVERRCRRRGIGRMLIERLCRLAAELGCYKVVLCCDPRNTGFYERCGFREHDVGMRLDIADRGASGRTEWTG